MRCGEIRKCGIILSLSDILGHAEFAAFFNSTSRSTLADRFRRKYWSGLSALRKIREVARWCGRLGMFGLRRLRPGRAFDAFAFPALHSAPLLSEGFVAVKRRSKVWKAAVG